MESKTIEARVPTGDEFAETRGKLRVVAGANVAAGAPGAREAVEAALDADDVEAYRAGDEGAFGRLYARHARRVLGLCRRFVGAGHADDVSQEAWVRVAKFVRAEAEPIRNFAGVLHRIVVREGLRYATEEKASVVPGGDVEGEPALQGLKAAGPTPEEAVISNEAVRRVLTVLDGGGVGERQAEAFRRRVLLEEDLSDVAARLGLSRNATVTLCRRAGVAIARRLEAGA